MAIGASVIGLGTSLLNNANNSKIASQTNAANEQIANNALNQQKAEFGTVTTDANPYLAMGNNADVQGTNYQQSPGFQNALNIGTQNVEGSAALNGLLRSGSAVKALDNYTVGAADNDFNNYVGQQQNDARIGEGALGSIGQAASGTSNAIGQNASSLIGSNNSNATAQTAANNANTSAIGSFTTTNSAGINSLLQGLLNQTQGGTANSGSSYTMPASVASGTQYA